MAFEEIYRAYSKRAKITKKKEQNFAFLRILFALALAIGIGTLMTRHAFGEQFQKRAIEMVKKSGGLDFVILSRGEWNHLVLVPPGTSSEALKKATGVVLDDKRLIERIQSGKAGFVVLLVQESTLWRNAELSRGFPGKFCERDQLRRVHRNVATFQPNSAGELCTR